MDREYTNIKDVNACLVWLPSIDSFPSKVHEMVSDEKKLKGSVPLRPGEKIRKFENQNCVHCLVSMCSSMY